MGLIGGTGDGSYNGGWSQAGDWVNASLPTGGGNNILNTPYKSSSTSSNAPAINTLGGTGNQGGGGGGGGGQTNLGQQSNPNYFLQGVQNISPNNGGGQIVQDANPFQFANQNTAQNLGKQYGLQSYGDNLSGPGLSYSQDMQMLSPNGKNASGTGAMNAGLVQDTLNRYGNDPSGYGNYLVQRDIGSMSGNPSNQSYGQWATSQPGFKMNPLLANSGPGYNMVSDGKGGYTNAANPGSGSMNETDAISTMRANMDNQAQQQSQQGQQQQQQLQAQQQQPQNFMGQQQQQGQGQQQNQQNQFFSQIAQLMPLLQMLGIFGGQGQQPRQRPPALTRANSGTGGFPYYSKFA